MESNFFVVNDSLKKEIEFLSNKLTLVNAKIAEYEALLKLYEEEEQNKKNIVKNYAKTYFQEKTKNKFRHCLDCNIDVKCSSYCNHIKSKVHLQNVNKLNEE